jgi:hypothetical protein
MILQNMNDTEMALERASQDRVRRLLGMTPLSTNDASSTVVVPVSTTAATTATTTINNPRRGEYGVFGLGNVRTLEDFERHCGVRFESMIIDERAKRGGMTDGMFKDDQMNLIMQLMQRTQPSITTTTSPTPTTSSASSTVPSSKKTHLAALVGLLPGLASMLPPPP